MIKDVVVTKADGVQLRTFADVYEDSDFSDYNGFLSEEDFKKLQASTMTNLKQRFGDVKSYAVAGSSLVESGGVIVSDNFQDGAGKAPFNLQVRNTTGASIEWVAVVSDAPYSEIPDLKEGDYSHEVSKGDEAYVYTFSGKLDGYQSITITGGVPSPAGTGEGLELFVKEGS